MIHQDISFVLTYTNGDLSPLQDKLRGLRAISLPTFRGYILPRQESIIDSGLKGHRELYIKLEGYQPSTISGVLSGCAHSIPIDSDIPLHVIRIMTILHTLLGPFEQKVLLKISKQYYYSPARPRRAAWRRQMFLSHSGAWSVGPTRDIFTLKPANQRIPILISFV